MSKTSKQSTKTSLPSSNTQGSKRPSKAQRGLKTSSPHNPKRLRKAQKGPAANNRVSHPSHYTWLKSQCGIEVIDITRHLNFNLGNVLKYVLRSGHKQEEGMTSRQKQIEDLQKAAFYLNDEIKRLSYD